MKASETVALALSFIALIISLLALSDSRRAANEAMYATARASSFVQTADIQWPPTRAIRDTVDGYVGVLDTVYFEVTHTDSAPAVVILPYGMALAPKRGD